MKWREHGGFANGLTLGSIQKALLFSAIACREGGKESIDQFEAAFVEAVCWDGKALLGEKVSEILPCGETKLHVFQEGLAAGVIVCGVFFGESAFGVEFLIELGKGGLSECLGVLVVGIVLVAEDQEFECRVGEDMLSSFERGSHHGVFEDLLFADFGIDLEFESDKGLVFGVVGEGVDLHELDIGGVFEVVGVSKNGP